MTGGKLVRKLPYYGSSVAALTRIATARSIVRCAVTRDKQLQLRRAPPLRLSTTLDLLVVKETLVDDVYGLSALDAPHGLVVDIGAGVGDFTLAAATRFPGASIWAFEPNSVAFRLLESNVAAHGCRNINAVEAAVGTRSRYLLHGIDDGPRASAIATKGSAAESYSRGMRLDETLPDGAIRLLKVDVEGLEIDVLESASGIFDRIERVVVEYHLHLLPSADERVAGLMRERGLETRIRPDPYDADIGYVYARRSDIL